MLSIPQIYRIGTMFWDDKYGTHGLSSDVSCRSFLFLLHYYSKYQPFIPSLRITLLHIISGNKQDEETCGGRFSEYEQFVLAGCKLQVCTHSFIHSKFISFNWKNMVKFIAVRLSRRKRFSGLLRELMYRMLIHRLSSGNALISTFFYRQLNEILIAYGMVHVVCISLVVLFGGND